MFYRIQTEFNVSYQFSITSLRVSDFTLELCQVLLVLPLIRHDQFCQAEWLNSVVLPTTLEK